MKRLLFILCLLLSACSTPAPKPPETSFPDPATIGARDEFARPPYPVKAP